jgi:hypothetical protein
VFRVPTFPFSSFRRSQAILELQFAERALPLWDRSGELWSAITKGFKAATLRSAAPNQTIFVGDGRYTMEVTLEKASITDHNPQGSAETTFDVFKAFADNALATLNVRVLKRVGNRYLFTLQCKSREDAAEKLRRALPNFIPTKPLFSFEPSEIIPGLTLEGNDGEVGCHFKLYQREAKVEFDPPPDTSALGVEKIDKTSFDLVLDLDMFTRLTIPVESWEPKSWMQGTYRTMTHDADALLSWAETLK